MVYSGLTVRPGVTFSDALERMEVEPDQAQAIIRSAGSVFDLRQFRAGNEIEHRPLDRRPTAGSPLPD